MKFKIYVTLFGFIHLYNCQTAQVKNSPQTINFHAQVVNSEKDHFIEGVTVEAQNKTTTTSSDGSFQLTDLSKGRTVFHFKKAGYVEAIKVIYLEHEITDTFFEMKSTILIQHIESSKKFEITLNKANLRIPANTFVNSKGQFRDSFDIDVMVIDPVPKEISKMPGEMTGITADG